jgi:glutathione synthase/RimK-type ligase-like ATP-grasp enzyme
MDMRFRLKLFPYKMGSASGKALANAMSILRVRPTYRARARDILINWGNSRSLPKMVQLGITLNLPAAVAKASNKLSTFAHLAREDYLYSPQWTTGKARAAEWLEEGSKVYCRTLLTSHSGNGIVIVNPGEELVNAPLYTKDCKHKDEYRVHVFKGRVIDMQQKKKRLNGTSGGTGIRNHYNGWIFAREGIDVPPVVLEASVLAVNKLGLDFGAVDIGYHALSDSPFLLEVNTAPGLTGTTLVKYTEAFSEYLYERNLA